MSAEQRDTPRPHKDGEAWCTSKSPIYPGSHGYDRCWGAQGHREPLHVSASRRWRDPQGVMSGLPVSTPMTVDEIAALFPGSQHVDIAPGDNETTYIEWVTADGFASLEVGFDSFAFSFIPGDKSGHGYGREGSLTEGGLIASIIRDPRHVDAIKRGENRG